MRRRVQMQQQSRWESALHMEVFSGVSLLISCRGRWVGMIVRHAKRMIAQYPDNMTI